MHSDAARDPRLCRALLCVCFLNLVLCASVANAQVLYGNIVGVVNDSTGAVVPGALVVATNRDTGLVRETTSSSNGEYSIVNVAPGAYDIKVTLQGFQEHVQTSVPVSAGQISRVNVALQVGALTESVTVESAVNLMQTEKADLSTELRSAELATLPTNQYRNYQSLLNLVPGTTPMRFQGGAETDGPARAMGTNVNGTSNWSNSTRTDGAANNNVFLSTNEMYVSPAETVESVTVSTNSFSAELGNAGGMSVVVVTKSGTNQFSGSAFEFFNSEELNATPFFIGSGTPPAKLPVRRQQFGGTLGGPIARNRAFFFGSYDGFTQNNTVFATYTVPSVAMRNGDFSGATNPNGSLQTIYDPTGSFNGTSRNPFPGNVIPGDRIAPISRQLQDLYPLPNRPGTGAGGLTGNYGRDEVKTWMRHQMDGKVNFNRTSAHQIWGKFSYMNAFVDDITGLLGAPVPAEDDGGRTKVYQATAGQTMTFGSSLLFDSTVGFSYMDQKVTGPDFQLGNVGLALGIPGTNDQGTGDPRYAGVPQVAFAANTITNLGGPNFWPAFRDHRALSIAGNLTKVRGNHEFKGGYTGGWFYMDQFQPDSGTPRGSLTFAQNATALRGGQASNLYNQYAAFLLGLVSTSGKSVQNENMTSREWQHGFYFRDRWTVSPRMTLDLGMRWEYYPIMHRATRGIEGMDLQTLEVIIGGKGGNPDSVGFKNSLNNFAPRLGFVYRMDDDTVLRSGYGMTYDAQPIARALKGWYPVTLVASNTQPEQFGWVSTVDQGIPAIPSPNIESGRVPLPNALEVRVPQPGGFDRTIIHTWNATVERRIIARITVEASYVGTQTDGIIRGMDLNAVPVVGGGDASRPYASRGRIRNLIEIQEYGQTKYHALQLGVNRPYSNGFLLKGQYTLSRARNHSDTADGDPLGGVFWTTPSELWRNWGLSGQDRTHNLQMAFMYDIPVRSTGPSGVLKTLASDWQVNGVFAAFSGVPFTVTANATALNTPGNTQTADLVGTYKVVGDAGANGFWFDPAAFAQPTGVRFGDTGRNQFRGPGAWNLDMSVARNITIGQDRLEFRVEASNVFNNMKLGAPISDITNPNFGRILTTQAAPYAERNIRIGLRFVF